MDRRKLTIAISALWMLASLAISQHFYNEVLGDGLFMRIFALAVVAAPVWGYFGWQWLSDGAPIRRQYLGCILVAGAVLSWFFASDRYWDEIAYIPFVITLAFVVLAIVGEGKAAVTPSSRIHPDKMQALEKVSDDAAPLRAATEEIANEILAHLTAMGARSPMPGIIHPDADASKAAYGTVYGAFTAALHNGGKPRHTAILAMYKAQILPGLTAMSMPRIPGAPALSVEDLAGQQFRGPVLKLMEIEEVNGRKVKQRLIDKVENPHLPLYENLRPYVSPQATEADLAERFETKFAKLYEMARHRVWLVVSKA